MLSLTHNRQSRFSTREARQDSTNRDRWLVSYIDVLTIVLIFFVGVAARIDSQSAPQSQTKPDQSSIAETSLANQSDHRKLIDALQALRRYGVESRIEPEGVCISLPQPILFASGEERINQAAVPIISRLAGIIGPLSNEIRLTGYADSVPIHNHRFRSNWELATARSLSLEVMLSERFGIPESRLSIASYGSYHPNHPNDTAGGRALNRRVEILIVDRIAAKPEPK